MMPLWREFLGAAGARFDNDLVSDFGNPADERKRAQTGTVLVPLTDLALLRCAGEDARSFLHNQFTSDINHLHAGQVQHTAWCSAKGRMQASFIATRQGEDFLLFMASDLLAATLKRLSMFILRAKARLSDASDSLVALGLAGPQAEAALAAAGLPRPEAAMQAGEWESGTVLRLDAERYLLAVQASDAPEVWRALAAHAHKVGTPIWHWLDIRAGLPRVTLATKEEFVPQMANFERIGGVSFHKGCYPGQEIIARTQYLGKVKRHLYRVRAEVPLPPGTPLFARDNPEQACGMIALAAPAPDGGYEALAVVMESAVASGVGLGTADGPQLYCTPVAN